MLMRRISCQKRIWHCARNYSSTQSSQKVYESEITTSYVHRLPAHAGPKPQREPFMKNAFLGKFDNEFLTYPEAQSNDRHKEFLEWLKPFEDYIRSKVDVECDANLKSEILQQLKYFGIFRAGIERHYDGLELSTTEVAKLIEVAGNLPWLGSFIAKNVITPVQLISKHGSVEQKVKYLPHIGAGEMIPALCIMEKASGPNLTSIEANATLSTCENYWILSGEKVLVSEGPNADLFIVFAHCSPSVHKYEQQRTLSIFMVERDTPGITCTESIELVGQNNLPVCNVAFNNVQIPKSNMISDIGAGRNILIDLLVPGNSNLSALAVTMLRNFIDLFTQHILKRKHQDRNLHEFEMVQVLLGQMISTLYGMESALYLTNGMIDQFKDQDATMEKAIVEYYCTRECVKQISQGMQLIGTQSYLKHNPQIHMFNDALALTTLDGRNIDASAFIALLGLKHAGSAINDSVVKRRNPFLYPDYVLKQMFSKEENLNLCLEEYLHLTFRMPAEILEKCVLYLKKSCQFLLEKHGANIIEHEMDLYRLSEIAAQVYVLVAVLGRGSRSYCTGIRFCDHEKNLGMSSACLTHTKIQKLYKEIEDGEFVNGDDIFKLITEEAYVRKQYYVEHPLVRNV